jgi:hypothetical protein
MGCHVDPDGGGLRTPSGRFYGMSTLPMFGAQHRPWMDHDRTIQWLLKSPTEKARSETQPTSMPAESQPASMPAETQPTTMPADEWHVNVNHFPAFGRSLTHGSNEMAFFDGRYAELNADPLLALGADARFAYWSAGPLFFPMQLDLDAAVHPIEHLTLATIVGARGRRDSLVFDGPRADEQPRFGVRDLYVMTHEWPFMSYLRAGSFLPPFGQKFADHTAYVRREFEVSQEDPANRVVGAEIGMAPNYPYLNASLFKTATPDAKNPVGTTDGWGSAANFGWRDLGWQLGGTYMVKRRPLRLGGDVNDYGVDWALNPWYYFPGLPLTYIGEFTYGTLQRPNSGKRTSQLAWYHELDWTAIAGVVLRARLDYWDPDREVKSDQITRPGVGLDWTIYPAVTLGTDARIGMPASGDASADVLVQLHGWF